MKHTFELELPEDFEMICDIFSIKPESIIEKILSRLSLPFYYANPNNKERWATLILLDYLDSDLEITEEEFNLHRPYMDKLGDSVMEVLCKNRDAHKQAETAGKKVMKQWHKAMLAEKARYIIDKLEKNEKKE